MLEKFTYREVGCYARGEFFGRDYLRQVLSSMLRKYVCTTYAQQISTKLDSAKYNESLAFETEACILLNKCCEKDLEFQIIKGDLHLIDVAKDKDNGQS